MRERIMSGEYRAGDRLPSEAELCALYGVSRMTVRRAVTQLVQDGVVFTENGRGTFVRAPELGAATFDLGSLRRLVDDAATTVKIIVARIVPPSPRGVPQARGRHRVPRRRHQARPQQRRRTGLLPQRVSRLRPPASARRSRVRRDRAARPPRERREVGLQVRPPRPACLHAHGGRGLVPRRRAGRVGVGDRASLLRLREPAGELGPVHRQV